MLLYCNIGYVYSQKIFHGIVTDTANNALVGVTIQNVSTNSKTITNNAGQFETTIEKYPTIITFSFIGFKKDTISIKSEADYESVKNIVLSVSVTNLPPVILTGAKDLVRLAVEKAVRHAGDFYYGKAVYRQFEKQKNELIGFKELYLNAKWFCGMTKGINIESARYAHLDKGSIQANIINNSSPSYALSGYAGSVGQYHNPLTLQSKNRFDFEIKDYVDYGNETVAIIRCTPKNREKDKVYFNGDIYIGTTSYCVYKIDGFYKGDNILAHTGAKGGAPGGEKDVKLSVVSYFNKNSDSLVVFDNSTIVLSYKYKIGFVTIFTGSVTSKFYISEYSEELSKKHYIDVDSPSADESEIKKQVPYDPIFWKNPPSIPYTAEESLLLKDLEKQKKVTGTLFQK